MTTQQILGLRKQYEIGLKQLVKLATNTTAVWRLQVRLADFCLVQEPPPGRMWPTDEALVLGERLNKAIQRYWKTEMKMTEEVWVARVLEQYTRPTSDESGDKECL
jgi:hypothetical protein